MTTSRYERLIILDLTATIIVFTVACIFWTSCDESRLMRPIPAGATVISSHRNLGPRLECLTTNIFLKSFFESDGAFLQKLQNNRRVARILTSRLTIMAYIPDFDQFTTRGAWSSNPAIVISSWAGSWTPILRWALWIHPPKDIMPLGDYNGHRLWAYKKPVSCFGAASYFSFAVDEGIFIGCLSRDRNGVAYLLRNYDGRKNSILDIPACNALRETAALDQVLLRINLPNTARNKSVFAVCSLDKLENDYLAATIRFDPSVRVNDGAGRKQDLAEIEKLYARSPSIFALIPSDLAEAGLNGLVSPAWERVIKPILSPPSATNNVCVLAVFTGDSGGKFGQEPFRITVPTLLLAVPNSQPEQAKRSVLELLDLINTRNRLGLILNSSLPPVGQCPIYAVESTSGAFLKSLPVEDQPAYAFYNDWFLLASNSAGLRKLLLDFQAQSVSLETNNNFHIVAGGGLSCVADSAKRDDPGKRPASSPVAEAAMGDKSRPATGASCGSPGLFKQPGDLRKQAFIRIDPGEGGKALRLALMASIVMLDADGRDPSKQNTIMILRAVRSWLEAVGGLQNCAAWLETENGKMVARLEIGSKKIGNEQ